MENSAHHRKQECWKEDPEDLLGRSVPSAIMIWFASHIVKCLKYLSPRWQDFHSSGRNTDRRTWLQPVPVEKKFIHSHRAKRGAWFYSDPNFIRQGMKTSPSLWILRMDCSFADRFTIRNNIRDTGKGRLHFFQGHYQNRKSYQSASMPSGVLANWPKDHVFLRGKVVVCLLV